MRQGPFRQLQQPLYLWQPKCPATRSPAPAATLPAITPMGALEELEVGWAWGGGGGD